MFLRKSNKKNSRSSTAKKIFWIVFAALLLRFFLAPVIWHPDVNNHVDWGIRFWQYGPANFYLGNVWNFTWPNQPPGTMYMFAGVRKLFELIFSILWFINVKIPLFPSVIISFSESNLYQGLLKLPAILADVGIGLLIYKILKDLGKSEKVAIWGLTIWLFNPVIWYNSAVWGQYDAVINFLALLSFYLLIKRKLILSLLLIVLSLYTKATLAIFLPVYVIVAIRQKYNFKKYAIAILVSLGAILLVTLPFSHGNPITWLYYLYKDKVFTDQLHVVTANAFNLWGAIFSVKDSAVEISDSVTFFGIAYKYWSYILYAIFYIPALWVITKKHDIKSIVWSLAMVSFSSFILLTNMHERYLYPLFPYFTILALMESNLLFGYIAVSLINLFNLYNFWFKPAIPGAINILTGANMVFTRVLSIVSVILFLFFSFRFIIFNLLTQSFFRNASGKARI